MINRYKVDIIEKIWSDENKFNNWLIIEKLNCEALNKIKKITDKELKKIINNLHFDINDIYNLELETKHDVIAFTRAISKSFNTNEKKWIHFGLTSTDIVDTGNAIAFKQVNKIILDSLLNLKKELISLAKKNKYTYQIGRTHGMHAEILTFGFKLINWVDELNRLISRFKFASNEIEVGKISGAVGTFVNTNPFIQDFICKKLKINSSKTSTQIISRDIHAFYFNVLNNIGLSINKFSTEMRHLHRTEVNEVSEFFDIKQKGSSSMPHKKNPINLENICGLSRLLNGYATVSNDNVNLWHERDISHSSNERVIFLDATTTIFNIINKFTNVIKNIVVNKSAMLKNIDLSKGSIFSQRLLLKLIETTNLSREEIYDEIQKVSNESFKNNISFLNSFKKCKLANHLTIKQIDEIFDFKYYSMYIDIIFKRVLNEK